MRIAVRLGSGLSRLAGRSRLELELADGATVGDLLDRVAGDRPELGAGMPSVLTVVRGTQVAGDRVLADGDEVALLIPVAGGTDEGVSGGG
jgi:molybdopterin converting factor small subunit